MRISDSSSDVCSSYLYPALAAKLQFQLDRLKLNERYGKQINKYLSEQRAAVLMFHEQGSELLSEFLRRSSVSQASSFGRNDWRVALLRALSADEAFCAAPELYLGLCLRATPGCRLPAP